MFLGRRERVRRPEGQALVGPVTVPGQSAAAYLEGERRGLAVYAPGGYHWVPGLGDEVLALKAGQAGEKPCVLGVAAGDGELAPGEVLITAGECGIRLGLDGTIRLTGEVLVNGRAVMTAPEEE